jgi:hypothetical protein
LRWDKAIGSDVAGYNVYRARGNDVRIEGAGKKLNSGLLNDPAYADATVDLSDSVARFYWVTAVNLAGKESGPSPYAMTFPDAPLAVQHRPTRDPNCADERHKDLVGMACGREGQGIQRLLRR